MTTDENIHPSKVVDIVGRDLATQMEDRALALYTKARDIAAERGILIADTKFEFGVNDAGELILVDEVLTPGNFSFLMKYGSWKLIVIQKRLITVLAC